MDAVQWAPCGAAVLKLGLALILRIADTPAFRTLEQRRKDVMGTGRKMNKQPRTRPKKSLGERRRRDKVQQRRLVGLGVDEDKVAKMTSKDVRTLLKRPAAIKPSA